MRVIVSYESAHMCNIFQLVPVITVTNNLLTSLLQDEPLTRESWSPSSSPRKVCILAILFLKYPPLIYLRDNYLCVSLWEK